MTINVVKRESAGGVVLNKKGQVLVVDQNGNSWSLPKGHLEKGESKLDAAKREIYEESGIVDLKLIRELGSYQRYRISEDGDGEDKSEIKTIYLFLFTTNEKKLNPIDSGNPQAVWTDKEKVADLLTHPKDKEYFMSIVDSL